MQTGLLRGGDISGQQQRCEAPDPVFDERLHYRPGVSARGLRHRRSRLLSGVHPGYHLRCHGNRQLPSCLKRYPNPNMTVRIRESRHSQQRHLNRMSRQTGAQRETAERLASACPEMTALADLIGSFAAMLVPDLTNEEKLPQWIAAARAAELPHLHSFARGLELDMRVATAAVTLPHHNGRTEGVNAKTKKIKRDMFGRAGFDLLPVD